MNNPPESEYLFLTPERRKKIGDVAAARQYSMRMIIENVHDPHNVSAIFRTCDSVGIPEVDLIYNVEKFPKIGKKSSASAFKWVKKKRYETVKECYDTLHEQGFKIYASMCTPEAKEFYSLDLTGKVAFVMGNEHRGVTEEAASLADETFFIPMYGFVQSLNVSVAAAVMLYEALRQRKAKGLYDKSELPDEELQKLINEWTNK